MEAQYVADSIADDVRVDGRTRLSLRDFSCKHNVNSQARGSAQVWLGETCVVCFVFSDVIADTSASVISSSESTENKEAFHHGLSVKAKIISSSGDVDASTVRSLNQDLSSLYRKIGATPAVKDTLLHNIFKSSEHRCGVGVKITAEITVLSGAGGNVLSACALAVKSALYESSFPPVHVTPAATATAPEGEDQNNQNNDNIVPEAASVEVDEQRRESGKPLGLTCPLVVKSIITSPSSVHFTNNNNNNSSSSTSSGFYCIDPCKEEERAAAYECIVGVVVPSSSSSSSNNQQQQSNDDDDDAARTAKNNTTTIVYSRIHSCRCDGDDILRVNDVSTLMSESVSLGERMFEQWSSKIIGQ